MPAEYEKMTEFGLVWTATLDGPESVGLWLIVLGGILGPVGPVVLKDLV